MITEQTIIGGYEVDNDELNQHDYCADCVRDNIPYNYSSLQGRVEGSRINRSSLGIKSHPMSLASLRSTLVQSTGPSMALQSQPHLASAEALYIAPSKLHHVISAPFVPCVILRKCVRDNVKKYRDNVEICAWYYPSCEDFRIAGKGSRLGLGLELGSGLGLRLVFDTFEYRMSPQS